SVYLDGDWCWNMNPFVVSDENKEMVINNITYLLQSFLQNTGYKYIVFCWVIHQEEIFREILEPLKGYDFEVYKISLICSENALRNRLRLDVQNGIRETDVIDRSVQRLPLYGQMDTHRIDVSNISAQEAADQILEIVDN
ncbi:MAG: nucleotide kinase, partial [Caproiciproducens sp.]|nr:nucleotide kinase [Caproiciproducens sp.]